MDIPAGGAYEAGAHVQPAADAVDAAAALASSDAGVEAPFHAAAASREQAEPHAGARERGRKGGSEGGRERGRRRDRGREE